MPAMWATILGLGAGGLGIAGDLMGGGPGREKRQSRDMLIRAMQPSQMNLNALAFGQQLPWQLGQGPGASQQFVNQVGGPILPQLQGLSQGLSGGQADIMRGFNQQTGDLLDNQARRFGDLSQQSQSMMAEQLADLENDRREATMFAGNQVAQAAQFGRGRDEVINRDANERLGAMNQRTRAEFRARCLSSNILFNQLANNSGLVNREPNRALQHSADSRRGAVLGAMNQQLGVSQNFAGLRAGVQQQGIGRTLGIGQLGAQSMNALDLGRAEGRTGLQERNLAREEHFARAPLDFMLSTMLNPINNPFAQAGLGSFRGSGHQFGSSLTDIGGMLAGLSGNLAGHSMEQDLIGQLLGGLRSRGGGGGGLNGLDRMQLQSWMNSGFQGAGM